MYMDKTALKIVKLWRRGKIMDRNTQYIKMCGEANLDWNGEVGDLCSIDGKTVSVITYSEWHQDMSSGYWEVRLSVNGNKEIIPADDVIPIYRQDQLQEMMFSQENRIWRLHEWFDSWYPVGDKTDSFEKLWLAFVMKEKYNKTWNGEKWHV